MKPIYTFIFIGLFASCAPFARKVDRVCIPIEEATGDRMIRKLAFGKYLYIIDGERVKGPANSCRCLPFGAGILTPSGPIDISNINIGDTVYTSNMMGGRQLAAVLQTNKVAVPENYKMLRISLDDGRNIDASASHPFPVLINDSHGMFGYQTRLLKTLRIGDIFDGAKIVDIKTITYTGKYTYDILPEGGTGNYWANNILVSSTLFTNISNDSDTILHKVRSWQSNVFGGECCTKSYSIGLLLTADTQDSIQIKSINQFELTNGSLKSNQFRDTISLNIEYVDDLETNGSLHLKVNLNNDPTKECFAFGKFARTYPPEDMGSVIQWPLIVNYLFQGQEYSLTILKPDETSSIYPP